MKKHGAIMRIFCSMLTMLMLVCMLGVSSLGAGTANASSSQIILSLIGKGKIVYSIGTISSTTSAGRFTITRPNGTVVTLTAVETTDSFMYWVDSNTGRVLSFDKSYSFVLSAKTSVSARFSSHVDTNHVVVYLNYAGNQIYNQEVTLGTMITPPSDTYLPGFTFVGWDKTQLEVRDNTDYIVVRPVYTLNSANYTVTLDAAGGEGAGSYSAFSTVKISADAENSQGQKFSYWKDSDNSVVSYDRVYKFKICRNVSLTAVYGETVTAEPVTRIICANAASGKITFYSERSVPDGYKVLQHGILLADNAENADELNMVIGNSELLRGVGTTVEKLGLYSLAKKSVASGDTWYARSYIICEVDGSQFIYYGNTVSQTL